MRLIQNTPQSANRDFRMMGHDRGVNGFRFFPHELDVTAFLVEFFEASYFEPALHLAKR